jgi:hypothetical protein
MTNVRRAALAAICGILALLTAAPYASGIDNETFGVTPFPDRVNGIARTTFSIPLETGATFEDAVRIYNKTDEDLNLTIYATDADTKLDDTISVGLREERARGVGAWIDLARDSVELGPRSEVTVPFRVNVKTSDPRPKLGAVVVEKSGRGLAANAAQRLHVVVRTVPPNTGTASKRVRSLVLRSPWVFVALFGLIVAGAVVWIGARRSRRPRDLVVPPGELERHAPETPGASRPVIKRLGAADTTATGRGSVLERVRASAGAARRRDDRPFLDDALVVEIDADADAEDADERSDDAALNVMPADKAAPAARRDQRSAGKAARKRPATATTRKRPAKGAAKPKAATSGARRKAPAAKAKRPGKQPKAKARVPAKKQADFIPLKDL